MTKSNGDLKPMQNKYLPVVMILSAILLRLLPHIPNVSPIAALALLTGSYYSGKKAAIITFISMFVSDLFLGFHPTMPWVYGGFAAIIMLGKYVQPKTEYLWAYSLIGSLLFFVISNLGVWVTTASYSKDLAGLLECYALAIPFFRNTILGDLFYTYTLFSLPHIVYFLNERHHALRSYTGI